uniref:Chitinase domain-containing protein 1 n=1 Tax=Mesocestoides corti TaxID=53468 RepID=A0A5K3FBQ6_MESCO
MGFIKTALWHSYTLLCLFMASYASESSEGKGGRPVLHHDMSVQHFLNSYDYFNPYELSPKKLSNVVLAYVTPWNSNGFEKTKIFAQKFSIVSPVWFQLKPEGLKIEGRHHVDHKWIEAIKAVNADIKVAPRVIFDNWGAGDYQGVFSNNQKRLDCIKTLRGLLKEYNFDGITLEVWMQHFGTSQQSLIDFLIELAKGIHKDGKLLILPIPPAVYKGNFEGRFNRVHFDLLEPHVDYFSLMSYDYSNPYEPGENSPVEWIIRCIKSLAPEGADLKRLATKRAKILVGLNFYGYDYVPSKKHGQAVLRNDVLGVVKSLNPTFKWHEKSAEHSLEYTDNEGQRHSMYFPTAYSIAKRVAIAEELGTGLSIWELGQGFDSFLEQI